MGFFTKGIEYNKLAKAFNGHYQLLQQAIEKAENEDISEDLLVLAYVARREIIERMETYNWNMNSPISIPMMPGHRKTLFYAYQQTIVRLLSISDELDYLEEVQEILDKGDLYYEVDKMLPESVKRMM